VDSSPSVENKHIQLTYKPVRTFQVKHHVGLAVALDTLTIGEDSEDIQGKTMEGHLAFVK
jgi:hypothetical protein